MGYYSSIEWEILITPEVSHNHLKCLGDFISEPEAGGSRHIEKNVKLVVHRKVEEQERGTLISYVASGIVATWPEESKSYYLEDHLQELVTALRDLGDYRFHGMLHIEGEENGDIWRLRVNNDTGRTERGEVILAWPEGFED